jgi:hypothetical protein
MKKVIIGREGKNFILLSLITSLIFISSIISINALDLQEDGYDFTSYDAESNILAFVPYSDSGLDSFVINKYPKRELIASYGGEENAYDSTERVNFKIGEWKYLGCDNETRQVYSLNNDTELIRSEFWFETDVIAWTDLDYADVFSDGTGQFETSKTYRWLHIDKQQNFGWDFTSLNSLYRITAWDYDLYKIYQKVGRNPSDSALDPYINSWPYNEGKMYWHRYGLKQLLSNPINYMPEHYNKYLSWNQLKFPGNPTNLRDFILNRFNDYKINGDLFFEVNMKESFWNRLTFPETVTALDNETGDPLGIYSRDRVVYSIDTTLVLGPNDPNYNTSRTRIVDLQDLYNNLPDGGYSENSAEGNMIASTENNGINNVTTNAVEEIENLQDLNNRESLVPKDVIGDGQIVLGVIDRTANWNWEYDQIEQGSNALLPGTGFIEPLIWEHDERPEVITEQDIHNLKPLDLIDKQDLLYGFNIKDRDEAVFKTNFKFGPKLQINYASLNIQEVALTMEVGLWGGYNEYYAVTDISDLTNVPYSANVRNIGLCQTLKLKVIVLTTYDYEPYSATEPGEQIPGFPLDDSEIDWPDEVDTGGDTSFTSWETMYDLFDAIVGWLLSIGWVFILIIIAILALVIILLKTFMGGGAKIAMRKMEQIQSMSLRNRQENFGRIRHIQAGKKTKATLVISFFTIIFNVTMLVLVLIALF